MATYSRLLLSGSTSGKPIPIVSVTSATATVFHTAVATSTSFDEIYGWVVNVSSAAATFTGQFGGSTDPGDLLSKSYTIPPNSPPIPVATGQVLNGGLVFTGFASVSTALNLVGFVNRIAP